MKVIQRSFVELVVVEIDGQEYELLHYNSDKSYKEVLVTRLERVNVRDDGDVESGPHLTWDIKRHEIATVPCYKLETEEQIQRVVNEAHHHAEEESIVFGNKDERD